MAKKKTYKRLTAAEKKFRKELREELREKGLIPPVKPRLNRKSFRESVRTEWKSFNSYSDIRYLFEAISWMVADKETISQEQVGVLKMMKIAMDIKSYLEAKKANGETEYSVLEVFEKVVDPIRKL